MKELEGIFELLDDILPADARKTVVFCEVEKNAYEIFYYSYFADDSCKQCYELADSGKIDVGVLETRFEKMAKYVRDCEGFNSDSRNVVTIYIEGTSENVKMDNYDKSVGLYKIKKDWKATNVNGRQR